MPIPVRNNEYITGVVSTDEKGTATNLGIAVPPDVAVEVPQGTIRTSKFLITLKFTKPVADVVSSAITIGIPDVALSDLSGEGDTYTAVATIPAGGHGTAEITFTAQSATGEEGLTGPPFDRVTSVVYDTRPETLTNPSNLCVKEYDFDDTDNPFVSGAGAFEAFLECLAVQRSGVDYVYAVIELAEYTTAYDRPPNAPILLGNAIDLNSQARACLVKINLSTCTWTVLKSYRFVSTAARSLHEKDGKVYWFEGSHYAYYNEGTFTRVENPDGEFYVHWVGDPDDVDNSFRPLFGVIKSLGSGGQLVGRWTRKASASADGEYSVSGNQITFVTSRTSASYADVRDAVIRSNFRLFIGTTLVRITGITLTNVNLNTARYTATFEVVSGTLPAVDARNVIMVLSGNSVDVYSKYRLRPLYVAFQASNVDWKSLVGHLYSVDASDTITDHGLNWLSSDLSADPNVDVIRPYYEEQQKELDRFYGIHGGTASPIIEDGTGTLSLITGYADLDKVADNTSEAARLQNWQWLQYSDKINRSIPVLETNDRTAWDILLDAALISNAYIAFDKDQFIMKPRQAIMGTLDQDITAADTTIPVENFTRDIRPDSGLVFIDGELVSYNALIGNNPGSVTRGAEGSIAKAHTNGTPVVWVDHVLEWDRYAVDPMDRFNIVGDTTNIYNYVSVRYGDQKEYYNSDATSITDYGLRKLELTLPLDDTQRDIAKYLVDLYLDELKTPRQNVMLNLKLSLYLNMMDVLVVKETDRTHLNHVMQIVELNHAIFENRTTVTCVLVAGIA